MVAYSCKRCFVDPIRSGRKPHTIRAERKRHARIGETVQLYTGMRTKSCMLIGTATCSDVQPITLDFEWRKVAIGPRTIDRPHQLEAFAQADGFDNWEGLVAFWRKEHGAIARWSGVIIYWKDFVLPEIAA
jgi:hypothetical protein